MSAQQTKGRINVAPADCSGIGIANFQDGTLGTPRAAMALTGRSAGGEGWHYLAAINDHPQAQADARRLAACWNACEGISTEELEHIASTGGMLGPREDVARIAAQRDLMLAALTQIERLSREADAKLVNVPAMLGDIARATLSAFSQDDAGGTPA